MRDTSTKARDSWVAAFHRLPRYRAGMNRIKIAFFVAPTLIALAFTLGAIIALPVMLVSTALFGAPLFVWMRRHGFLSWSQVTIAGLLCGTPILALSVLPSNGSYLRGPGITMTVLCLGTGATTGLLFWWIGIFRNPEFPTVSRRWPWTMLILIPIVSLGIVYLRMLSPVTMVHGRVMQVLSEPNDDDDALVLRLRSGRIVTVPMAHRSDRNAAVGACYWAYERRSLTLTGTTFTALGASVDSSCN